MWPQYRLLVDDAGTHRHILSMRKRKLWIYMARQWWQVTYLSKPKMNSFGLAPILTHLRFADRLESKAALGTSRYARRKVGCNTHQFTRLEIRII